jgi:hypothetical protein
MRTLWTRCALARALTCAVLLVLTCAMQLTPRAWATTPAPDDDDGPARAGAPETAESTETNSSFVQAKPIRQVTPKYPKLGAFPALAQMRCTIMASVDQHGVVTDVVPKSCFPTFFDSAETALRQWEFEPATFEGQPVASKWVLSIAYRLPSASPSQLTPAYYRQLIAQHTEVPTEGEGCIMQLVLHPAGELSDIQTSDKSACIVLPVGWVVPRRIPYVEGKEVGCRVAFEAVRGDARNRRFIDCDEALQATTRKVVERWVWGSFGAEPTAYDLVVWYSHAQVK